MYVEAACRDRVTGARGRLGCLMQQSFSVTAKMSPTRDMGVLWGTDYLHKKSCSPLDNTKAAIPEGLLKRITGF